MNTESYNPKSTPTRKRIGDPGKWVSASESLLDELGPDPKRESQDQNGIRIPLRCEMGSKTGDTSNGGNDDWVRCVVSSTVACPSGVPFSVPDCATDALYLVLPLPVDELYCRLVDHGVRFCYKTFLRLCSYLHNQLYKVGSQGLGTAFETSAEEAKKFVKELKVNGEAASVPVVLDRTGITRKVGKYKKGEQAQRREFAEWNEKSICIMPYDPKWLEKVSGAIDELFEGYFNRPELLHIVDSYNTLSYYESDILEVRELCTQSKKTKECGYHYKGYADALLSNQIWYLRPKGNYVYAYIRYFPSSFRIKGFFDYRGKQERVCLVDIKSSHPTLLCKILRDYLLKQKEKGECVDNAMLELDDYQSLIESGKLYEAIQGPEKRKDSKLKFQKWLNGEGWHYEVINEWFKKEFPELFCIIEAFNRHELNHNYEPFHAKLRRLEAEIVMHTVGLFGRISLPAIPIIDELMVPESRGEDAAYKLQNIIFNMTDIRPVVSVDFFDATAQGSAREEVYLY